MKCIKFLGRLRFNFIDIVGISIFATMMEAGHFLVGALVLAVITLISVAAEDMATNKA